MHTYLLDHPVVAKALFGALTGWASAAHVDVQAFLMWKNVNEAASYGWGVAIWRWFQGAVVGMATGAGFGYLVS